MIVIRRSLQSLAVAVHLIGLLLLLVFGAPMLLAMHPAYARLVQHVNQVTTYRDGNRIVSLVFYESGWGICIGSIREWRPLTEWQVIEGGDTSVAYLFSIYQIQQRTEAGQLTRESSGVVLKGSRIAFVGLLLAALSLAAPPPVRTPLTAIYGRMFALPMRLLRHRRRPQGFEVVPPNATGS